MRSDRSTPPPSGVQRYQNSFGKENVAPDAEDMKLDSLMWIASCTKPLTAISILQLVERSRVALDEPLDKILPEFAPPVPVVTVSESGELVTTSTDKPLTLRILLTHTSGLAYGHPGTPVDAWRKSLPESSDFHPSKIGKREIGVDYRQPLIFLPGEPGKWKYGPSIDWVGKVVERVNGEGLSLGDYMAKYIFGPLEMTSTTFRPVQDPRYKDRLFARSKRLADGSLVVDPMEQHAHLEPVDEMGGGGLYSTVRDYIKVLESLLLDDGKLLPSHRVEELFTAQLPESPELQKRLAANDDAIALTFDTEVEGTDHVRWSWSLCGLSVLNDVPEKCTAGTGLWSGLANLYWVRDVTAHAHNNPMSLENSQSANSSYKSGWTGNGARLASGAARSFPLAMFVPSVCTRSFRKQSSSRHPPRHSARRPMRRLGGFVFP